MPELPEDLLDAIELGDVKAIARHLEELAPHEIAEELTRLDAVESALVWRVL